MSKKSAKKNAKRSAKKPNGKRTKHDPLNIIFGDTENGITGFGSEDESGDFNMLSLEAITAPFIKKLQQFADSGGDVNAGNLKTMFDAMSDNEETPQEQAQELMYQAAETSSEKKRTALAEQALKLDPDCVDAMLLLADTQSRDFDELEAMLRKAVASGERSIGKQGFKNYEGHFWTAYGTRPYMRALESLARHLERRNKLEESLAILQKMLKLNPFDNQGVRYHTLYLLIALDKDADAEELYNHKEYRDDCTAWWAYARALLDFRKSGDSAAARKSLAQAVKVNKYVPAYLTGKRKCPVSMPFGYQMGSPDEAVSCFGDSQQAWQHTAGALDWLKVNTK